MTGLDGQLFLNIVMGYEVGTPSLGFFWGPAHPVLAVDTTRQWPDLRHFARTAGAIVLVIFGLIQLVPRLQDLFARATSRVSASGTTVLALASGRRSGLRRRLRVVLMVANGVLIGTGTDKTLEAWMLDQSPQWLTALTTRF
jgi:cytochrome c-type biogenesis protein